MTRPTRRFLPDIRHSSVANHGLALCLVVRHHLDCAYRRCVCHTMAPSPALASRDRYSRDQSRWSDSITGAYEYRIVFLDGMSIRLGSCATYSGNGPPVHSPVTRASDARVSQSIQAFGPVVMDVALLHMHSLAINLRVSALAMSWTTIVLPPLALRGDIMPVGT